MDLIPELRRAGGVTQLVLHDQDLPDGHYALTVEADTLRMLALNLDRAESDLGHLTVEELKAQLELQGLNTFSVLEATGDELSLRLAELDQGRKLWKWFILFALIFLLSEVLLIRYLR